MYKRIGATAAIWFSSVRVSAKASPCSHVERRDSSLRSEVYPQELRCSLYNSF